MSAFHLPWDDNLELKYWLILQCYIVLFFIYLSKAYLLLVCLLFSGRKASCCRMRGSLGLSVMSVCQRPVLRLVCPWGTVSVLSFSLYLQFSLFSSFITLLCLIVLCCAMLRWFRCGQRWECQRGSLQGQWLWSFNQTQQCLGIQRLSLYNISLGEKADVIQTTWLMKYKSNALKCFVRYHITRIKSFDSTVENNMTKS